MPSLRLAYSTYRWQNPDLERDLAALVAAGFAGWETRHSLDWLGSARRVRQICARVGIETAAVCGPNATLSSTDPAHQISKRRIEFAADLEVATFMTKGPGRLERETTDADLDRMAAVYEDLATFAAPLGVTLVFHPHINHLVDSAAEWKRFMSRLDCCRLSLDMSHAVYWGYDPVAAVHDFRDRIAYVHLHDHKNEYKGEEGVELGEAQMCDFPAFLGALEASGYQGWVTACPGTTQRSETERMQVNRDYLSSIGY